MIVNCKSENTGFVCRNDNTAIYFNEIRKYPILTSSEERVLLNVIKTGSVKKSQEARDKLIQCNQRFVVSVAKKWQNGDNLLDLINEGNIGLMKAIDCFDLDKKQRFLTYAVFWIRKAINDYVTNLENSVKVNNATKIYTYVAKARNSFFVKNERYPTIWELKEELKDTYNVHISNAEDLSDIDFTSIDVCELNQNEDVTVGYGILSEFNVITSTNNTDDRIEEMHNSDVVQLLLSVLDERERYIIEQSFGIGCQEKSFEIIAKDLKICKERVRQLFKEALKKMNNSVKKGNYGKD